MTGLLEKSSVKLHFTEKWPAGIGTSLRCLAKYWRLGAFNPGCIAAALGEMYVKVRSVRSRQQSVNERLRIHPVDDVCVNYHPMVVESADGKQPGPHSAIRRYHPRLRFDFEPWRRPRTLPAILPMLCAEALRDPNAIWATAWLLQPRIRPSAPCEYAP